MNQKKKPGRPPRKRLNKKKIQIFLYPDEIAAIDKLCVKNGDRSPWIRQAVKELRPEFWITGLRAEQTEYRSGLQQIDQIDGITKICPLLKWTDKDMNDYIAKYDLPNEPNYFDPTKVLTHHECGLHTIDSLHLEA